MEIYPLLMFARVHEMYVVWDSVKLCIRTMPSCSIAKSFRRIPFEESYAKVFEKKDFKEYGSMYIKIRLYDLHTKIY